MYLKHGSYYYVKANKWQKIGSDLHSALTEYARIVAVPADGVPALIDKAMPFITSKVADSTKKQYVYCAGLLKEIFAEFTPDKVTHGSIIQMQDMYAHSPMTANRMLTVLKLVYQWAMDREFVHSNPCLSIKRLPQGKRDRLITQDEYKLIYDRVPHWMQNIMDLLYLTGQRIGDVLKIEYSHLLDDGIFIEQQKTGKKLVVAWTPELREVIARTKESPNTIQSIKYVISGRAGTPRAHSNVWRTFKMAARNVGLGDTTLHDMRAMSGTATDNQGNDPSALLGHTDRRTTQIYLRDKSAKVVSGPNKKAG